MEVVEFLAEILNAGLQLSFTKGDNDALAACISGQDARYQSLELPFVVDLSVAESVALSVVHPFDLPIILLYLLHFQ